MIIARTDYYRIYKQVPFYAGLGLLAGQLGPTMSIYQSHLYQIYDEWRSPFLFIGIFIQFLCLILFILYLLDRKKINQPIILDNNEVHKNDILKPWQRWLLPRTDVIRAYSSNMNTNTVSNSNSSQLEGQDNGNPNPRLKEQVFAAFTNGYNYLFAFLHSCLCIPQALLGALWLKPYLELKFKTTHLSIDARTACNIAVCSNLGAAISSFIFGYIGKRKQLSNPYIYRTLISVGYVLWSMALLIIYIDAKYHTYYSLFVLSLIMDS